MSFPEDDSAATAVATKPRRLSIRWCGLWTDSNKEDGQYFTSWMNSGQKRPLGLIIRRNKGVANNFEDDSFLFFLSPHVREEKNKRLPCPGPSMLCIGGGRLIKAKTGSYYINGPFLNGYLSIFKSQNTQSPNGPPYFAVFAPRAQGDQRKSRSLEAGEDVIPF